MKISSTWTLAAQSGQGMVLFLALLVCHSLLFSVSVSAAEQYTRVHIDAHGSTLPGEFQDWWFATEEMEADVEEKWNSNIQGHVYSFAELEPRNSGVDTGKKANYVIYVQCATRTPQWSDTSTYPNCGLPSGLILKRRSIIYTTYTCWPGYQLSNTTNAGTAYCTTPPYNAAKSLGSCAECLSHEGNPVHPGTGNKFQIETDYESPVPGGLKLKRYYNSQISANARFGHGWIGDYYQRVNNVSGNSNKVDVVRPDRKTYTFTKVSATSWVPEADVTLKLTELKTGSTRTGWQVHLPDDTLEVYEYIGSPTNNSRIISSTDRNGLVTTFDYNVVGGAANVLLVDKIIDPYGRELQYLYNGSDNVIGFVDPDGNEYEYVRDGSDRLTSVIYPDDTPLTDADNPRRIYHYNEAAWTDTSDFTYALTGITDENGNRFANYYYDSRNRVTISEHAGGADRLEITYNSDGTRTLVDALGNERTLSFTILQGLQRLSTITGDPCESCGNNAAAMTYDANGFVASKTDFNGNVTTYVHNSRGLETSRTEADGEPEERTITTTWHATLRVPLAIAEPGRETTFTYDGVGRVLTRTETDTTTSAARTTTYTYHDGSGSSPEGLLATVDGPRTDVSDVTSYEYDASGNLVSVINALSQETGITSHDASGRPLSMTDPNGTVTAMTYDKRGRLLTRTTDSQTTTFEYDGVGNITKTTLPNGAFLINEYDDAQRLIAVEDNLGNRIEYTLDDRGNRIKENVKDSGSTLTRTLARTYNELNRLVELTGGEGQIVAYGYDDNGNQTGITVDPTGLNQATVQAFDALNRLVSVQDAEYGTTAYEYDARDNLIEVTDPTLLVTTYDYDGLDNLVEQTSPDTGITTYDYDEAGNRIEQTDARNVAVDYSYDALNRLTAITYPDILNPGDNPQNVTYTYDSCTNGIGRLCEMADESGTTEYTYDTRGNRASETITRGVIVKTINYTYDAADQIETITYPSGRVVEYTRDANGRVEQVDTVYNLQNFLLADAITYLPFGPLNAMTYGNNLEQTRGYDLDYRVTQLLLGDSTTLQTLAYTYDDANNITDITNVLDGSRTQAFGYDDLNRLTDATGIYGSHTYTYDANGNRQTQTVGLATETYSYVNSTHRLDEIDDGLTTQTFSYDNNGNTTSNGTHDLIYGDNNRLATVEVSSTPVAEYVYNGKGERVIKDVTDPILYYYDQNGLLLAELDENGDTIKEYAYLDGQPLTVMGGVEIYNYHNDHLGTPQLLTDDVQDIVWAADYEPFGKADVTTSTVLNNLRFPGQYFDDETDLHYNYFRDYDPATGRYVQSDPIGLNGGSNTYGYVNANPIVYSDSYGLLSPEPWSATAAEAVATATRFTASTASASIAAITALIYPTSAGEGSDKPPVQCENDDDCQSLYQQIEIAVNGLQRRYRHIRENMGNIDPFTHQEQFRGRQANLRKLLFGANTKGCLNYRQDAWYWASVPAPKPGPKLSGR